MLVSLIVGSALARDCTAIADMVQIRMPPAAVARAIRAADDETRACLLAKGFPPEDVEPVAPGDPVGDVLRAYRRKDVDGAVARAADLARRGEGDAHRVRYLLGRSLQAAGVPTAAQAAYFEVLKGGPGTPYFAHALANLVGVTRVTGDRSDLGRIAANIPMEAWPEVVRDELCVAVSIRAYEQAEAKASGKGCVDRLRPRTLAYSRGKYVAGLAFAREGKLKSAVRAFTDVVRHDVTADTAEELAWADRLRDLSLLGIARVYYGVERFGDARTYWEKIPATSPLRHRAVLEGGWGSFMEQSERLAAQLVELERSDAWLPEAALLRALHTFNYTHLEPRWTERIVAHRADFAVRYDPVRAELREVLKAYGSEEARDRAAEVYTRYFGPTPAPTKLPPALLARFREDRELAGLMTHLAAMDAEVTRVRKARAWKGAVAGELLATLAEERTRLERRAGLALLQGMIDEANLLWDFYRQMDLVAFEARANGPGAVPADVAADLRALLADEREGPIRTEMELRVATLLPTATERIPVYEALLARLPADPNAPRIAWELALDLIEAGEPARAKAVLTRILAEWPESSYAGTIRAAQAK